MKKIFILSSAALVVFLLYGLPAILHAGEVTLEITTTTGVSDGTVSAEFRITNRGTEPAGKVSVLGTFLDRRRSVYIADRINPNQTVKGSALFKPPFPLNGSYPLYVTVSYQHANGLAASSGSVARVNSRVPSENRLSLEASLKGTPRGTVSVFLETPDQTVDRVTVTPHAPDVITVEPSTLNVDLVQGRGQAEFSLINMRGKKDERYGIFFVAEYETTTLHNLATAEISVPVVDILPEFSTDTESIRTWFFALLLVFGALLLTAAATSGRARKYLFRKENVPHLLDLLVLAAVEIFIFSKFDLQSLISATTNTGGDTASHYYTLEYLRHTLLPAGRISGWTMGNYAGFPILQFYFPLPFLLMSLLGLVMPLQVAFKLVTLLGVALLPAAAYIMMRFLRCAFPGPAIGAVLMLPFLFNSANSMWGGNILSTLAGEFSYSISLALSLILVGSLYRGTRENSGVIRNGILVFLVGFSHGYTLLFAEAMSLFLLFTPYGLYRRVFYLLRVYGLGFCLLAFWLVPLLVFTRYTTSYHLVWTIRSIREIVPEILLPVAITALAGSVLLLIIGILRFQRSAPPLSLLAFLWFGLAAAVVFFVAAPRIGVVDIRYVPYGQLMICLMAALFLGWVARHFLNRRGLDWLLLIIITAAAFQWTGVRVGPVGGWSKWNYEGFEAKAAWPVFKRINDLLAGDFQDPRVVYEHSQEHNIFGSSRAFESLPLFAGRATLEGLYMQASITAPFVFYIQSLISHDTSQPFPQYSYTTMNYARAQSYLKLFNVRDLILRSRQAKSGIRQVPGYQLNKSLGQYELWQLAANRNRYVEVLEYEPVLYTGDLPWKQAAHQWFVSDELLDTHLVFNEAGRSGNAPLTLTADSLDTIPKKQVDPEDCRLQEEIKYDEILLETNCIGKPHLVKVSFHPDWQVDGARKIYLVSPSFMLIYPEKNMVRLSYGPGPWDRLGQAMTALGLLALLLNVPLPAKGRETAWSLLAKNLKPSSVILLRLKADPSPRMRKTILMLVFIGFSAAVATFSYKTYINEPHRAYNRSIHLKDAGRYQEARKGFRRFAASYPLAEMARESMYYIAITYYLEAKDQEAIRAFGDYIAAFPQGSRVPESHYHIGLALLRRGEEGKGIQRMQELIDQYPQTPWAGFARERLLEHGRSPSGEAIELNSTNLHQYMGRAIDFFNRDRLAEARPILLQISERFPDFDGAPQALAALALSYYKEGNCRMTITYYRKLIDGYPGHRLVPEAYFHIGLCHEKAGKPDLAEEAFQKTLELDANGDYGKQAAERTRPPF